MPKVITNKITVTLGEIINATTDTPATQTTPATKSAFTILLETKFPIKVSYTLNRIYNALTSEINIFNQKRNDLIIELGTKDDKGVTSVKADNFPKFSEEINKLANKNEDLKREK